MAAKSVKKTLDVSLDPGFNGFKMVVEGLVLDVPFVVDDITSAKSDNLKLNDAAIYSEIMDESGNKRKYIAGESARTKLNKFNKNSRAEMVRFYSIERFAMPIFEAGLKTIMAYGLYRFENSEENKVGFTVDKLNQGEFELTVAVALPHSHEKELFDNYVKGYLVAPQKLVLSTNREEIAFDYTIPEGNIAHTSQARVAMFSVMIDEEGNYVEEYTDPHNLPALIVDGGYKTMGLFTLQDNYDIDEAESNEEFAMYNINEAIANAIKPLVPGIESYTVEKCIEDGKNVIAYWDGDTAKTFDINPLRENIYKEFQDKFWKYLLEKTNKFFGYSLVIIAGGTGKVYSDYITEKLAPLSVIKTVVARAKLNGKEYDPVFAVAIGQYKLMKRIAKIKQE